MNPVIVVFVSVLAVAQLAVPRRLAFLPLVIAGLHLGNVEILPELTPGRLLIVLGLARALSGGWIVWPSFKSKLDVMFLLFAACALLSTVGHKADQYIPSPLSARAGLVINVLGSYLYARAYLPDITAFRSYTLILPFILIPLGLFMALEKRTGTSYYSMLGSVGESSMVREGKIRATGPFRHPILAGTAGATALPFAILMWRLGRKRTALIGAGACLTVVIASASSGPLAAVAVAFAATAFWKWREHLGKLLWGMLIFALLYSIVKGRGPWYLMASIDLAGGSTGWHRAKLMDQGFTYLSEWWLWGTDYTRHWMASGTRWNPNMVDITNYYLHLGVIGGLPLMFCLFGLIFISFKMLIQRMSELRLHNSPDEIVLWCAFTSLATHAISFVSISYFDQMYLFFYLLLGSIPGLVASSQRTGDPANAPTGPVTASEQPVAAKPLRFYS